MTGGGLETDTMAVDAILYALLHRGRVQLGAGRHMSSGEVIGRGSSTGWEPLSSLGVGRIVVNPNRFRDHAHARAVERARTPGPRSGCADLYRDRRARGEPDDRSSVRARR